ncbi:hypothetical protein [Nocardia sp. NPDC127526]
MRGTSLRGTSLRGAALRHSDALLAGIRTGNDIIRVEWIPAKSMPG